MRFRVTISLVSLLAAAVGCGDVERPSGPGLDANLAGETTDQPFYYHQQTKVYLTQDPREVVVRGDTPLARAQQQLTGLPVSAVDGGALPNGHRLIRLTGSAGGTILRTAVDRIRAAEGFRFSTPVYRTANGSPVYFLDEVDVAFRAVPEEQITKLIAEFNLEVVRPPRPDSGFYSYRLRFPARPDLDVPRITAALYEHEIVDWAGTNQAVRIRPAHIPTDPYYPEQFNLRSTHFLYGLPVDINVELAWTLTKGVKAVRVVVIDDGVDWLHQDLGPVLGGGMGYDAVWQDGMPTHPVESAYAPYCNDYHGTAVGGIIGAAHDGVGMAGIAPGVTLTSVRILRHTAVCNGVLPTWHTRGSNSIADAINWAWKWAEADVINNSWNVASNNPIIEITAALDSAATSGRGGKGTVVVFSTGNTANRTQGNTGIVLYPATLPSVIAVGAIDRFGAVANYSPNGSQIALVAPSGELTDGCLRPGVLTTDRWGSPGCNTGPNGDQNYNGTFSGTSAAAPQVAAVAALLLSREPHLTRNQVRARLLNNADPWGPAVTFGAGKLNAYKTLYTPPPPGVAGHDQRSVGGGAVLLRLLDLDRLRPVRPDSLPIYLVWAVLGH
jgi:subtilisin family serine protease